MAELTITAANFESEVLKSELPVLVDFWAVWCGPCQMLGPIISQVAEERAGKLKVGKVNVDEEPLLARQFGVSSIPTVILFKNGAIANKFVGYRPKEDVDAFLG